MDTETDTEPQLRPLNRGEQLVAEVIVITVVTGTLAGIGLAAYGAISLTQDVTTYFKRRFGRPVNISSL